MSVEDWISQCGSAGPEEIVQMVLDDEELQSELAAAMADDELEAMRLRLMLVGAGVARSDAAELLRRVARAHPPEREHQGPPPTLRPCPVPGDIPHGWLADGDGVRRVVERGDLTYTANASFSPVWIARRTKDIDTGDERWLLAWVAGKRTHTLVTSRGVAQSARRIVELADKGFPVSSDTAGTLVAWLEAYVAHNLTSIPSAWSARRMGWARGGFLWGEECIGGTIALDASDVHGVGHIAAACTARHDAGAEARLHRLRVDYPALMVATAASLASAALGPLDAGGFVVAADGRTSSGKTTWLRLAASAWGSPDERDGLVRAWDSTAYYLQRDAAALHSLPLCLDDTRRWKGKPNALGDCVYDLTQGRERGRMVSGAAVQEQRSWRLVVLSTGEDPLSQVAASGGLRARVLQLWGSPFAGSATEDVAETNAAVELHHGVDGPSWVRELQVRGVEELRARWDTWTREHPVAGDVGSRLARHASLLAVVARCAAEWLGWPVEPDDAAELVWTALAPGLADADQDADPSERAWSELSALLVASLPTVVVRGETVGRWSGQEWHVLPGWLRGWAEAGGYRVHGLLRDWASQGRLRVDSDAHRAVKVQWGEHRVRVYALRGADA